MTTKEYSYFFNALAPIVVDTYVSQPVIEKIHNGDYFFQEGLWTGFDEVIYFYDKKKIEQHKNELLLLCKIFPRFHKPTEEHAGTISSFALLPDPEIYNNESLDKAFDQLTFSLHFANLLCGADIASIAPVIEGTEKAFLIVLDKKYLSCFEE